MKVDAGDEETRYLNECFENMSGTAYNNSVHTAVYFHSNGTTGGSILESYIADVDLPGKVRVSSADSLAYLGDQFYVWPSEENPGAGFVKAYADVSNGTTVKLYATAHTETGKVRVNSGDDLEYLEDQLFFETTDAYDSDAHQPVYSYTAGGTIALYTAKSLGSGSGLLYGRTAEVIPGATGNVIPGVATVVPYVWNEALLRWDEGSHIEVYNSYFDDIPEDVPVWYTIFDDGTNHLVNAGCAPSE